MPDNNKYVDYHLRIPVNEKVEIDRYITDIYNGCPPSTAKVIRHLIKSGIKQERKRKGL